MTKENSDKIIDWDIGKQIMGGSMNKAKEMLEILVESLPGYSHEISEAFYKQDCVKLTIATHKLHGAACYCGTPRLKTAAMNLEAIAKKCKTAKCEAAYNQLISEIDAVLKAGICSA